MSNESCNSRSAFIGRRATLALGFTLVALLFVNSASAQSYPTKPIRLVVPYSTGGATDLHARLIGQRIGEQLGQPVVVDNRAGAGGTIGTDQVAKASPDGYTLLAGGVGTHAINPHLFKNLPFDALRDFTPVALLGSQPNVLVVNPSFPAQSVADFIALAKAKPGGLSYASPGAGTSNHLAMEMLKKAAGIFVVHIPYRGGGAAVTDVLGNQVPILFINVDVALPHIRAGRLRPLAVSSAQRTPVLPEVPTLAESGFPGFEATSWTAVYAPARTPADVVARLHGEIQKALARPDVGDRLRQGGFVPSQMTQAEFVQFNAKEYAKWGEAVRRSGATPD